MAVKELIRKVPGASLTAQLLSPAKRHRAARWRRIAKVVNSPTVMTGPFTGMELVGHRDTSMTLGCYEQELHPLIESWTDYDRIIDVGCAEGWYIVGLARRLPNANVCGIDVRRDALSNSRKMAGANGVVVQVRGEATASEIAAMVDGRTLIIMDIEGAEVDLLQPDGLKNADIVVEMHDFIRPGATEVIMSRFTDRTITTIKASQHDPAVFPILKSLSQEDQLLAVNDNRPPGSGQCWLWMPAP